MSIFSGFASEKDRLAYIGRELSIILGQGDEVEEWRFIENVIRNAGCSAADHQEALMMACLFFSRRPELSTDRERSLAREVIHTIVERGIDLNFEISPGLLYLQLIESGCRSMIDIIDRTANPRPEYIEMVMYLIDAGLDVDRISSAYDPTIPHEREGLVSRLVYLDALPLVAGILEHHRPNRSESRFCVETVFREVVDLRVPDYVVDAANEEHTIVMRWFEMLVQHGLDIESSFDGSKTCLDVLKSLPAVQVDVPALSRLYVALSASKAVTDVTETSVKRKRAL